MSNTLRADFDAMLFDMDGTILTSIESVERSWTAWANRAGLPSENVLAYMHGRRAIDTIRKFAPPTMDVDIEAKWLDDLEREDLAGINPMPGAERVLSQLQSHQWAVVTSAGRDLAQCRIRAAGLPNPPRLVSSDDVKNGKPDPEGFLKAARLLGVKPSRCLVFEDTAAGAQAGISAGASVVLVTKTRPRDDLPVHAIVPNFEHVMIENTPAAIHITITA